ncbi:F-box/WD repeat-containing protein mec-15 [Caenorhabditis elegans]|uniref:F-box/WD repeat-containing protein mec-15 n=1 Tax=Caenorhabditis elegans TaxID=6239 RepID=MEC15_CAEEL|nr:F-box/WD repeat-containing protein mec-15 [Caenorhabditis elegans]Q22071.1 RecName: Full=F-box/WD repeat-containing protein mec-15; AltName: Full=Mechanosensory abnormality protein 15 [Caenorhabditis elegans]CAA88747.1 F-box/WD repeat-containing protein mec-15 [Caenorhabditis elegans]|eukprot:NP_496207.1 F-box/WD repeat-containing protein mec-15 [Caenorhabditis elegans]
MTNAQPTELISLPSELLCHLFTYLPQRQLITEIPLVCRRFNTILNDDKFWSRRIRTEQKVRLPDCELKHPEYEPKKSFYAMHRQRDRWRAWETQTVITAPGHSATVDSVMLFENNNKQFCLSGSRDRTIRLWSIENARNGEDTEQNPWTVAKDDTAHSGWIWNMAQESTSTNFYTTSWDSTVKSWHITDNGALQNLNSVNVGSAAQCISCSGNENEVVCTTFAKRVAVIDSRTFQVVADHKLHKRAVIALAVQGDKIFTSGEDRLMMMVDRRNFSKPVLFEYSPTAYKSCLSLQCNQLLTSTSDGKVKLYDANNFNVLQTYSVGSYTRQSFLEHGAHLIMARSLKRNYTFSIYSPGTRSQQWCASHELAAEPAKFDYSPSSRTLAIGNGDSSILFCLPASAPDQEN